jgi:hypothetical protein
MKFSYQVGGTIGIFVFFWLFFHFFYFRQTMPDHMNHGFMYRNAEGIALAAGAAADKRESLSSQIVDDGADDGEMNERDALKSSSAQPTAKRKTTVPVPKLSKVSKIRVNRTRTTTMRTTQPPTPTTTTTTKVPRTPRNLLTATTLVPSPYFVNGTHGVRDKSGCIHYTPNRNFSIEPIAVVDFDYDASKCSVPCVYSSGADMVRPDGFINRKPPLSCAYHHIFTRSMEAAHSRSHGQLFMSVDLRSDVPVPYFSWEEYDFAAPVARKTAGALAAAFISNCGASNGRLDVLKVSACDCI